MEIAAASTPESSSTSSEVEEGGPNRVVSIAVPPKMKNTAAPGDASSPEAPIAAHPPGGNRVRTVAPSKSQPQPPSDIMTSSAVTERAVAELRKGSETEARDAVVESHQSLWTEMDASFFSDLDSLTPSQLKARIVQLATEMKDRTKWEAVRLKEFLAMKEKETADR